MGDFVKICKASEIAPGGMKGFTVGDQKILVANVGGKYYALEDKCTHMGARLSTGMLFGNIIMCMAHAAQFDVATGAPLTNMGKGPVKKYEVRLNGEDLEVQF